MALTEVTPQSAQDERGMPITVFYLQELPMGTMMAWYVDDEGQLKSAKLEVLKFDWRFDHKKGEWIDVSPSAVKAAMGGDRGQQDD